MRLPLVRASAAVGFVFAFALSSEAAPLTLQDLLNGQSVNVGRVEFLNFRNFSSSATGGALPINPAAVIVTPVVGPLALGLAFEGAAFGADPGQSKRWSFDFDGIVVADGLPIDGAFASIDEAVFGGPGGVIFSRVIVEPLGLPSQELFVQRTYDDRTRESMGAKLGKVLVGSFHTTGGTDVPTEAVSLNFAKIQITYTAEAPEPATLVLVGVGVVGLLAKMHRRL